MEVSKLPHRLPPLEGTGASGHLTSGLPVVPQLSLTSPQGTKQHDFEPPGAVPQDSPKEAGTAKLSPFPANQGQWQSMRRKSSAGSSGIFEMKPQRGENKGKDFCKKFCCCCLAGSCACSALVESFSSIFCCLCNAVED